VTHIFGYQPSASVHKQLHNPTDVINFNFFLIYVYFYITNWIFIYQEDAIMSHDNVSYNKKVEYMLNKYMETVIKNSRLKYYRKLEKLNSLDIIPLDNIEEYPDMQIKNIPDCIDDENITVNTIELAFSDKARYDFIKQIPDKYKYVIFYKVIYHKSNMDIAEMLGISKQAFNGLKNRIINYMDRNGCHCSLMDSLAENHKSAKKKGVCKMSKKNCF
jgi:Uncharacterized integral membrane protein